MERLLLAGLLALIGIGTVAAQDLNKLVVSCPAVRRIDARRMIRVKVEIDRAGAVVSARALHGHPLVKKLVTEAVRKAVFRPSRRESRRMRSGIVFVTLDTYSDMKIGNVRCG